MSRSIYQRVVATLAGDDLDIRLETTPVTDRVCQIRTRTRIAGMSKTKMRVTRCMVIAPD